MRYYGITGLIIFLASWAISSTVAQSDPRCCKFWRPTYFNGGIKIGGHFRYEEGITNDIYNYHRNPMLYGGVLINSSSYFWHPNFMVLDFGAEYNPMTNRDEFLVVPDQSEALTFKRLDVTTTFFKQKPVSLILFANFNESYTNRESLSDYRLNSANAGGTFSFTNKVIPFQVRYLYSKWNEKEIQTGRNFFNRQSFLQADLNKSFSTRDRNEFRFSHNNYYRQDDHLDPINNVSENFDLTNSVDFDKKQTYTFRSHISGIYQKGDDEFDRTQANEALTFKLPLNLTLSGYYDYYNHQRPSQRTIQNNFKGILGYRLFQSLFADVYFEDYSTKNTFYKENNNKTGIELRYTKKIPANGQITLSYQSYKHRQRRVSDVLELSVFAEEHVLADGEIELLSNPYVHEASVVVRDRTGTVIYQLNFDYILIKRNNYLEIQRIPGGQIPNSTAVYVDYTYLPPGSYQFDAKYRQFATDLVLFGRILDVYVRFAKQDYDNLEATEMVVLNYFTQQVYGCRLEYKFASGGAEYESYKSTIIPYRSMRYFIDLQGSIQGKLLFSVNGNMRDYTMLADNSRQKYIDFSGNLAYNFSAQTRLLFEAGYRKQIGQGIDLDLLTGRVEFNTVFRQVFLKVGFQVYKKIYLGENTNFFGGYFEIVRSFSWNRR